MSASYKPPLAWGKALMARRKLGERIGLLVVSVHDWDAGSDICARANTARVVVPDDKLPHELDWSPVVALDCLIVGDCADSVFWATVTMLFAAGAASIWGVFAGEVWRLERWASKLCPQGFFAADGPVPESRLGLALQINRDWSLMTRAGVYGTAMFDAARTAAYEKIFGAKADQAMAWVDARRARCSARAA